MRKVREHVLCPCSIFGHRRTEPTKPTRLKLTRPWQEKLLLEPLQKRLPQRKRKPKKRDDGTTSCLTRRRIAFSQIPGPHNTANKFNTAAHCLLTRALQHTTGIRGERRLRPAPQERGAQVRRRNAQHHRDNDFVDPIFLAIFARLRRLRRQAARRESRIPRRRTADTLGTHPLSRADWSVRPREDGASPASAASV